MKKNTSLIQSQPQAVAIDVQQSKILLEQSNSIQQVDGIRRQAETVRKIVEAHFKEDVMQYNQAAEIRLRAERRIGQLLAEMNLHGGDRKTSAAKRKPNLKTLNIDHQQSARWQKVARINPDTFERYIGQSWRQETAISTNGLHRFAAQERRPQTANDPIEALTMKQQLFACALLVPPWERISMTEQQGQGVVNCLRAIAMKRILADHAHVFLWMPPEQVHCINRIFRAWGVIYRNTLVAIHTPAYSTPVWQTAHMHIAYGTKRKCKDVLLLESSILEANGEQERALQQIRKAAEKLKSKPYLQIGPSIERRGWVTIPFTF